MKPIYKILTVAAIIVLGGIGVYFAWKKITPPPVPPEVTPETGGDEFPLGGEGGRTGGGETGENGEVPPEVQTSGLTKLSENPVFDFWGLTGTDNIFYLTPDGRVFNLKEGPDLEVSKQTFDALNSIEASPRRDRILAAFGDPLSPSWGIFDGLDKTWRPLPAEVRLATWGASSDKIFVLVGNGGALNLSELDITRTPWAAKVIIGDFRIKDIELHALNSEEIYIHEKPSGLYPSRVWKLNAKTKDLNQLLAGTTGLWLKWIGAGIGAQFIEPDVFRIVDKNLKETVPLVFTTFPSKCGVGAATSTIYCFSPKEIPESNKSVLERYLMKQFMSVDELFAIDTREEDFERVFESGRGDFPPLDAKNPFYAEGAIYFINRYDSGLYKLKLSD